MKRYRLADPALADFLGITQHIGIANPAAYRVVGQILKRIELIADFPQMGRLRPELKPNLRSFPVKSYVVYYRELDGGIEVLRVLHGARDVSEIFGAGDDADNERA